MEFTFLSCIYVFECGHSCCVRSTKISPAGALWHCASCDTLQVVTDVVAVAP